MSPTSFKTTVASQKERKGYLSRRQQIPTTKKNKKEEFGHFLNVVQFPINQLKNVVTDGTEVLQ